VDYGRHAGFLEICYGFSIRNRHKVSDADVFLT
jgi:hypothetical protein